LSLVAIEIKRTNLKEEMPRLALESSDEPGLNGSGRGALWISGKGGQNGMLHVTESLSHLVIKFSVIVILFQIEAVTPNMIPN
jgi:hypothetical protein